MQLLVGVVALSIVVITPLWAARIVLVGIMSVLATERERGSTPGPHPQA